MSAKRQALRGHLLLGVASGPPTTHTFASLRPSSGLRVSPSNHWAFTWLKDVPGGSYLVNCPPYAHGPVNKSCFLRLSPTKAVQLPALPRVQLDG